ncbi:MAG: response regulator [Candidatus Omnitrophica bacterium]|nr:response regulator [Candidatus Omnitrophota bacterium]
MKILIVDDSLLDRKLLSKTLINSGVKNEILQAENGEAALGVIAQHLDEICLMFCDYQMPNMSGLELMEGLVKVPATARIPIVMVTASAAEENKKEAYAVNPKLVGYVVKPYKPDEVLAVIKPYVQL